ncbi:MAG: hypothetical protein U0325_25245 [Polyangiales bacterium]
MRVRRYLGKALAGSSAAMTAPEIETFVRVRQRRPARPGPGAPTDTLTAVDLACVEDAVGDRCR